VFKKNPSESIRGSIWRATDPSSLRSSELTRQREETAAVISISLLSAHLQSCGDSYLTSTEHGSMHLRTNENEKDELQSSSSVNKG